MTEINFTKNQWCDFIIRLLYTHAVRNINGYPELGNDAKQELLSKGIIERSPEFQACHQLTERGYKIIDDMLSYEEWIKINSN